MVAIAVIEELGAATTDPIRFGGKAAGLGRLIELGHRVPEGFAIAAELMETAIEQLGLRHEFDELEASMSTGAPDLDRGEAIRAALVGRELPPGVIHPVKVAAETFGDGMLIVRSSAQAEDAHDHSYAGIFESVAVEADDIAGALQFVWASVFAPRALSYAAHAGLRQVPRMGVIVQRYLPAERSGVMFTTFPGPEGDPDILVEHVAGTAEKLVLGEVTPSRLWLRMGDVGNDELAEAHTSELQRLATVLEEQFAGPQDVEWCVIGPDVFVVQTRPVTAPAAPAASGDVDEDLVLLHGTAASPGMGSGPVHVSFNVDEALALESGDVLVTPMTNPDMVVAMRNAAGIVTDVGGMICHAAIVSRELQLPCVVGTGTATTTLGEDEVVTVDGSNGVVLEGAVAAEHTAAERVSAEDLWTLWPEEPQPNAIPLVSTVQLLESVPDRVRRVAYLVDNDLHCDDKGLWVAGNGEHLSATLRRAADSAPQVDEIITVTGGAVSSDDLVSHVQRLGDARIVPGAELAVAWDGAGTPDDELSAVPLAHFAAPHATQRSRLGPIDASIARSLDPSQGPGPTPQIQHAAMPDPQWRQRWWDLLVEYGRFHRQFATTDATDDMHPWIEIRPEVLTSPLLKSLVQPGFEMVPHALEFVSTRPMHTKWAKCRFHVRADTFGATWAQLVQGTWERGFMEHFLRMVRRSYDHLAEVVRLFPNSDDEARGLEDGRVVALVTAWWPRWVEFFALCLFIQAQGEAILYPVIAETVDANLADLGDPPPERSWPGLPDLVAPTSPVLSAEYVTSIDDVRTQLDAAGLTDVETAAAAVHEGEPPELADVVHRHLERWHWMRDRDLLFEPWDTVERVIETALRTDPHPPVPYAENLERNRLALALHADLAAAAGRGGLMRHGVRFLQDLNVERENHHVLWLEYSYPLRRVVLEMERRLIAAGWEVDPGLVFYLQMPELLDAFEALPALPSSELADLAVARRRAYRHEAHLEMVPPETLYEEDDYY